MKTITKHALHFLNIYFKYLICERKILEEKKKYKKNYTWVTVKKHERRKHWSFKSEASYFFPKPPSLPLGFWRCLQFPKQPSTILNPTRYIHSHSHLSLFGCSESKRKARKRREKERLLFFFFFYGASAKPWYFLNFLFGNYKFYRSHFICFLFGCWENRREKRGIRFCWIYKILGFFFLMLFYFIFEVWISFVFVRFLSNQTGVIRFWNSYIGCWVLAAEKM